MERSYLGTSLLELGFIRKLFACSIGVGQQHSNLDCLLLDSHVLHH